MKPRITLGTFRYIARAEERMARDTMPRTAAASPEPLEPFGGRLQVTVVSVHSTGARLTAKMSEMAH